MEILRVFVILSIHHLLFFRRGLTACSEYHFVRWKYNAYSDMPIKITSVMG